MLENAIRTTTNLFPGAPQELWIDLLEPAAAIVIGFVLLGAAQYVRYATRFGYRGYVALTALTSIVLLSGVVTAHVAVDSFETRAAAAEIAITSWAANRYNIDVSPHLAEELLAGRAGPSSEAGAIRLRAKDEGRILVIEISGLELPVVDGE